MAFNPQEQIIRTATRIRKLRITLYKSVDSDDEEYPGGIQYQFTVDDQDDRAMGFKEGDMMPHITQQEKTQLQAFFDKYWGKVEDEVLP